MTMTKTMTKPMNLISLAELRSMLIQHGNKTATVSLVCATIPSMKAKSAESNPNPYRIGRGKDAFITVCKTNKVNGIIGGEYDSQVLGRLDNEGKDSYDKGTSWHRHIPGTCLSCHKDVAEGNEENAEAYLRFVFKAKGNAEYFDIPTGKTIEDKDVSPFLTPPSTYANQNLDNAVIFVMYSLSSIVEIAINGERFRISDNLEQFPIETRRELWNVAEKYMNGESKMSAI